jgi:hypothetical protein
LFNKPRAFLILLAAILLFSILSPRVFASDDSNPTGITPTVNTSASNLTTNQTIDAVNQLLAENNALQNYTNTPQNYNNATQDPRYQHLLQLVNEFEAQAHSGQNIAAGQTLTQIQQYLKTPEMQQFLNTPQGREMMPGLQSLLSSMYNTPTGFSVDPALLQESIGAFDSQGLASGWSGMSVFGQANNMRILGDLMQNIDFKNGSSLLQNSNLLNGEIASGLFGKIPPGFGRLGGLGGLGGPNPGIPALPNIPLGNIPGGRGLPSFPGVPSIPGVASSVPGVPSIPSTLGLPTLPLIIAAIAGVAAVLFILRKRFGFLGRRITPTTLKTKPIKPDTGLNLQNPRDLIIYYFRKVVTSMSKRGFPRLDPETHREFSGKCSPRPEAPSVKNISVLYEKAMFSGSDVTMPEADDAKDYAVQVEKTGPAEEKRRFGFRSSRTRTPKIR